MVEELKSYKISFLSANGRKGNRIKIFDCMLEKSKIIDFNSKYYSILENAISFFKEKNINIVGYSHLVNNSYIILTKDFKTTIF